MFFNKNKKKQVNTLEVDFKIPQLDYSGEGIKKSKPGFKSSMIGSPMFGSQVKDDIVFQDLSDTVDIRKNYDNFRKKEEKLISDEELIEKYGTKYCEFRMISNETRKEVYGTDTLKPKSSNNNKKIEVKKTTSFTFVEDKKDFIDASNKNISKPIFEEKVKENISFEVQSDDFEFNSFETEKIEKPISKIPSFLLDDDKVDFKPNLVKPEIPKKVESIVEKEKYDFDTVEEEITTYEEVYVEVEKEIAPPKKVIDKYSNYKFPSKNIFKFTPESERIYPEWLEEKKEIINKTLLDFDLPGEVINYTMGPTLTRYEILLSSGVNVKKIANLFDTFQMNLGAKTLRIQAPIPGKKTIGIEVPNDKSETVFYGDILTDEFYDSNYPLRVALGKDIDGKPILIDIASMPHGLIAGSTGSGKSVCINTILVSLLLKNRPDDLKLILVDPKKVELISYNDLPHLVTPVIDDPTMASESLKWAVEEMDRRYEAFSNVRARNIKDYNEKAKEDISLLKMAYIVIVIDELADLMLTCSQEVEDAIKRLTAKSRAAGIHLLVATQRPTVDVVKGTIKANIPSRIAFRVFSGTDSMTILDEIGAEQLLGKGDMLVKQNEIPNRLQGAYVADREIDAVTDFIRTQAAPDYIFTHEDLKKKTETSNFTGGTSNNTESAETLYQIAKFCIEEDNCSINSIQQQFNVGFNRAQRIVTFLEEQGIVSEKNGTKGREILIDLYQLNQIFEKEN